MNGSRTWIMVATSGVIIALLSWNVYTTHILSNRFAAVEKQVETNRQTIAQGILPRAAERIGRLETIIEFHGLDRSANR